MRLSYFFLAPVLALTASAQILDRDFSIQGCVGLTTVLGLVTGGGLGLTGAFGTETQCRVSHLCCRP